MNFWRLREGEREKGRSGNAHTGHVEDLRRNISLQIVVDEEFPIARTHQQSSDHSIMSQIVRSMETEESFIVSK